MQTPAWLDRTLYPFAPHSLELDAGRMHYVDEGQGPPVVLVHGTPVWSFLYRDLIRALSPDHRVIAPDHLGFGLSDKPEEFGYRPQDHARNLRALIERLGLRDVTLVVHDFGGPIGLSYAVEQPENVARLVIFNTWMWSLRENVEAARISRVMGGPIGSFLYKRLNFSARALIPLVAGERRMPRAVHRHYIDAAPGPRERHGMWVLARELAGSSDWYDSLWRRRERIRSIPALLLWGLKDPGVRSGVFDLARFQGLFPGARTLTFPAAGHFVQEEEAAAVAAAVREFLGMRSAQG
ncbi:MAG TPA: alpha/beta fold hydrolase [Roseiflexaceae bacterium]|nr:alpha/beta fold hydrolase [Roseiflexaceae bacterium]